MALAAFGSCRSFISLAVRLGFKDPTHNHVYEAFCQGHAYYWLFFATTLLSHVMVAFLHTGLPEAGDPDAGVLWTILGLGAASSFAGLVLFSSCRVCSTYLDRVMRGRLSQKARYPAFFGKHYLLWMALMLLAAAHVVAAYLHSGIWPG